MNAGLQQPRQRPFIERGQLNQNRVMELHGEPLPMWMIDMMSQNLPRLVPNQHPQVNGGQIQELLDEQPIDIGGPDNQLIGDYPWIGN